MTLQFFNLYNLNIFEKTERQKNNQKYGKKYAKEKSYISYCLTKKI